MLKPEDLHARLFELQLSPTYLTMVKALMGGPQTADALAAATGMSPGTIRIRVCQLRTKLERVGLSVSKMGDGPVPNGGPPRAYRLIAHGAKPPSPPVPVGVPVEPPASDWTPDF